MGIWGKREPRQSLCWTPRMRTDRLKNLAGFCSHFSVSPSRSVCRLGFFLPQISNLTMTLPFCLLVCLSIGSLNLTGILFLFFLAPIFRGVVLSIRNAVHLLSLTAWSKMLQCRQVSGKNVDTTSLWFLLQFVNLISLRWAKIMSWLPSWIPPLSTLGCSSCQVGCLKDTVDSGRLKVYSS